MVKIILSCLVYGAKKDGSGNWYKGSFKTHDKNGKCQTKEYYIPSEDGDKMVKDGIIEDVGVDVTLTFNQYLLPEIKDVTRVSETANSKAVK